MVSSIWLSAWTDDRAAFNDTQRRDMYLAVYGALGLGQGEELTGPTVHTPIGILSGYEGMISAMVCLPMP